jgi:putative oxidoreductase
MSFSNGVRWASRKTLVGLSYFHFLPPLLARLVIGYAFFETGKGKLGNLERATEFFSSLGIPAPGAHALFIGCLECFGGLMLMAGMLTRSIAALLGCTMIVALATADRADFLMALKGEGDKGLTDVVPLMFGMFLLYLVVYGPGALSIDYFVRRWLIGETPPQTTADLEATRRLREKHA